MDLRKGALDLRKQVLRQWDHGVAAALPPLHFGATVFTRHFFTIGSVIAMGALGFFTPQITHLFQWPSLSKVPWPFVLGYYAYVAFVAVLFLGLGWRVVSVAVPRPRIFRALARAIDGLIDLPAALASRLSKQGRLSVAWSLVLVGAILLVWSIRRDDRSTVLAATPMLMLGGLGGLFGIWFGWTVEHPFQSADGGHPVPAHVTGRFFACILVSIALCELVWFLANTCSPYFSFRLYSICAVLELCFVVVLAARYVDFLQVSLSPYSRLVATLLFGFFVIRMPRDSVGRTQPSTASDAAARVAAATEKWFETLRSRLDHLPPDGPVIVVSASGGGSRAALFTGLVLEALASTPTRPEADGDTKKKSETFGDHIALISSVSGGSLATAYYAYRQSSSDRERKDPRKDLKNTTYAELVACIKEYSGGLEPKTDARSSGDVVHAMTSMAAPRDPGARSFEEHLRQTIELCQSLPEDPAAWTASNHGLPVSLLSTFADDMCTDFMAPILRGTLLVGSRRGENLTAFWEEHFSWKTCNSLECGGAEKPLLLFNATDADRGTPFVVGFPPLPPGLLPTRMSSLSELDPGYQLTLGEAVRVSSNFPWLVQVASLAPKRDGVPLKLTFASEVEASRPVAPPAERPVVDLLDGGVVDNSGLDTLASLLQRLVLFASDETPATSEAADQAQANRLHEHASQILATLHERGLLLVEIDSGAKKKSISTLGHLLPTLLEPVEALFVAGSMNERYRHKQRLKELFQFLAEKDRAVTHIANVSFSLDSLQQVMTSWALGPSDKAKVWVNFLVEFSMASEDLKTAFGALTKSDSHPQPAPAEKLEQLQKEVEDNAAIRAKFRQSAQAK